MTDSVKLNKQFDREFMAYSFTAINNVKPHDCFSDTDLLSGNRIILPSSVIGQLDTFNIAHPSSFKLSNKHISMFAGVHQFTAHERLVYLPDWMMTMLDLNDGDRLVVQSVTVPKATKVIFDYDERLLSTTDPRTVIEMKIKKYPILHENQMICFTHARRSYAIRVAKLEPAYVGTTIDTDISLEFTDKPVAK